MKHVTSVDTTTADNTHPYNSKHAISHQTDNVTSTNDILLEQYEIQI
jgi:hypothetical protein